MKKLLIIALLMAAVLTVAGCSGNGGAEPPEEHPANSQGAEIADKAMQLSASSEDMNEVDAALLPYFEKAFYGAIIRALGEEQTLNYKIGDFDSDGSQELAVTAFFEGNTANSCMLFKNAIDYCMYYDPGIYSGDIWHKYRYDNTSDSLLWGVGSISADDTYSRYYALVNGKWTLRSIMSGSVNETDKGAKNCIVNDEYATADEFVSYAAGLAEPEEKSDVFNIRTHCELKKAASEFKKYLKYNYEPAMVGYIDKESGKAGYIITIDDILLNYRCEPFIENEETDDKSEEYIKTVLRAKTVCFVLDETDSGTRIRSQILDKKTVFNRGSAGITANINGSLIKTTISAEDSGISTDFITLEQK